MGEMIIPRGIGKPIRGIYSPEVQKIAESLGPIETRRASHVEPTAELSDQALIRLYEDADKKLIGVLSGEDRQMIIDKPAVRYLAEQGVDSIRDEFQLAFANQWWADCLPVGGPVLGPFPDRDTALAEESKWLHEHNIPTCRSCADNPTHDVSVTGRTIQPYEPPVHQIPAPAAPSTPAVRSVFKADQRYMLVEADHAGMEIPMQVEPLRLPPDPPPSLESNYGLLDVDTE